MEENTATEGQVQQQAPPVEGQGQEQTPSQETEYTVDKLLEEIRPVVEKFKSPKEAAKSILEAQKKITEQGQENSELRQALQAEASQRQQLANALRQTAEKGTDFFDNPELKVRQTVRDEAAKMKRDEDIAELREENPELWDMTAEYTRQVLLQNPHLNTGSKAGLKKAYLMGQDLMRESAKRQYQIMNELIGNEIPPANGSEPTAPKAPQKTEEQIKKEQEKNKSVYLPNTGGAKPIDETQRKMQEAIEKGDVDTLLDLKFKNIKRG